MRLLRRAGAKKAELRPTGCAALHPWLKSDVPFGAKKAQRSLMEQNILVKMEFEMVGEVAHSFITMDRSISA